VQNALIIAGVDAHRSLNWHRNGTTASVGLRFNNTLLVGSVGDTRSYVFDGKNLIPMSRNQVPGQPEWEAETAAYYAHLGNNNRFVRAWGYGDFHGKLSARLEVTTYEITRPVMLIQITRGLTSVASTAQLQAFLQQITPQGINSPEDIARVLAMSARFSQAEDDTTVLVTPYAPMGVTLPPPSLRRAPSERALMAPRVSSPAEMAPRVSSPADSQSKPVAVPVSAPAVVASTPAGELPIKSRAPVTFRDDFSLSGILAAANSGGVDAVLNMRNPPADLRDMIDDVRTMKGLIDRHGKDIFVRLPIAQRCKHLWPVFQLTAPVASLRSERALLASAPADDKPVFGGSHAPRSDKEKLQLQLQLILGAIQDIGIEEFLATPADRIHREWEDWVYDLRSMHTVIRHAGTHGFLKLAVAPQLAHLYPAFGIKPRSDA
jgi:hypothetical protein